jgi:alcohol dehydrogenase
MDIRLVSGVGAFDQVGALADSLGLTRALIVTDRGIVATGFPARAATRLRENGIAAWVFDRFGPNPDTRMVEAGRIYAADHRVDGIVALGGGSSLDCAKGINFLLTNGGSMRDYRGHGKATQPMLPSIGVPTTAGTGARRSRSRSSPTPRRTRRWPAVTRRRRSASSSWIRS